MPSPVISVPNLRKSYGSTVAVENVSLDVNQGEIFGLIGQNGAEWGLTGRTWLR